MNVGKHLSHFQDIHEFLRLQYICIDVKTCSRDCEFLNLCAIFLFNNFMYPVSSWWQVVYIEEVFERNNAFSLQYAHIAHTNTGTSPNGSQNLVAAEL